MEKLCALIVASCLYPPSNYTYPGTNGSSPTMPYIRADLKCTIAQVDKNARGIN